MWLCVYVCIGMYTGVTVCICVCVHRCDCVRFSRAEVMHCLSSVMLNDTLSDRRQRISEKCRRQVRPPPPHQHTQMQLTLYC